MPFRSRFHRFHDDLPLVTKSGSFMLFSLRFKPILLNSDAVESNFGVVESNSVELALNSVDVRLNSIDIESANRWKYYAEPSNLIFS